MSDEAGVLMNCPFCGAQPEHDFFITSQYPHEVYCEKCIGVVTTQQKTFEEAIAAWNRRAAPVGASVPSEVAQIVVRWCELLHGLVIDLRAHNIDTANVLRKEIDTMLAWLEQQQRGQG